MERLASLDHQREEHHKDKVISFSIYYTLHLLITNPQKNKLYYTKINNNNNNSLRNYKFISSCKIVQHHKEMR